MTLWLCEGKDIAEQSSPHGQFIPIARISRQPHVIDRVVHGGPEKRTSFLLVVPCLAETKICSKRILQSHACTPSLLTRGSPSLSPPLYLVMDR